MIDHLDAWEGTLRTGELDGLIARVPDAVLIGQRPGDFALRSLVGGAAAWPSGRCFNETLEIRWWPGEDDECRSVLILNRLPEGWTLPATMKPEPQPLAEAPDEDQRYLCVGQYDEHAPEGAHRWWESRYGRCFEYLDSAPPSGVDKKVEVRPELRGRVYLRVVGYELADGRTQHRLLGFEHAGPEEGAS
ncbi:hypothetical protein WMF39_01515 [Sorangium sp. So ce1504]|uniref:hypothetical protein n=1 Tax=Sorangium sp. So ce1504 TaxID=3133337 RepID=UPI003F5DA5EB